MTDPDEEGLLDAADFPEWEPTPGWDPASVVVDDDES